MHQATAWFLFAGDVVPVKVPVGVLDLVPRLSLSF